MHAGRKIEAQPAFVGGVAGGVVRLDLEHRLGLGLEGGVAHRLDLLLGADHRDIGQGRLVDGLVFVLHAGRIDHPDRDRGNGVSRVGFLHIVMRRHIRRRDTDIRIVDRRTALTEAYSCGPGSMEPVIASRSA